MAQNVGVVSPDQIQGQIQTSTDMSQMHLYQQRMNVRNNQSQQRSVRSFDLAYFISDINYTAITGGQPTFSTWDLNRDYTTACPVTAPSDTVNNFTIKWAAVVFDEIFDENSPNQTYDLATTAVTIDSVFFEFEHTNTSGLNDTIVIHLMDIAATGSGLASSNGGIKISNDTLWTDTIITNVGLGQAVATLPIGILDPTNDGFVILVEYFGSDLDLFTLNNYFRDDCAGACFAAPALYPNKSLQYLNLDIPLSAGGCNNLSGTGNLVVDCDQSGSIEPENCEEYVLQNWGLGVVITVDAPFAINATTEANSGCPGDNILLKSNITSGLPPFGVNWTDINGTQTGIVNPFNPETEVSLPTCGSYPCTVQYIVEVVDAAPETLRDTVSIIINGITIDAGADISIACGQTGTLTAQITGVTSGGGTVDITWSNGDFGTTADSLDAGTYCVTVTNTGTGCTATDCADVTITGISQALSYTVSSTTPCVGDEVVFTNTSTELTGWTWSWDLLNDNTFSGAESPTQIYTVAGAYTTNLQATDVTNTACVLTSADVDIVVRDANNPACQVIDAVEVISTNGAISVYPNPTSGQFVINFKDVAKENVSIIVFDLAGKAVYSNTVSTISNNLQTIDISNNANGVYFIRVVSEENTFSGKITLNK